MLSFNGFFTAHFIYFSVAEARPMLSTRRDLFSSHGCSPRNVEFVVVSSSHFYCLGVYYSYIFSWVGYTELRSIYYNRLMLFYSEIISNLWHYLYNIITWACVRASRALNSFSFACPPFFSCIVFFAYTALTHR